MRLHVRLSVGKAQPKLVMKDASFTEGEEQDEGKHSGFKNTKLRGLSVRTSLLIHVAFGHISHY